LIFKSCSKNANTSNITVMSQISYPKQPEQYTLEMEALGRLTLPESVLQQLDLKQGSRLILIVGEDGTLRLISLREQVRKLRGILKNISPNRSLVDELIQERREEAASE
jgi:bifunctional DNA-binding transcriptional regulator/antitoxin component of YhaV-PrlF toxin-antitoxin module